jgi:hypothetical protein
LKIFSKNLFGDSAVVTESPRANILAVYLASHFRIGTSLFKAIVTSHQSFEIVSVCGCDYLTAKYVVSLMFHN